MENVHDVASPREATPPIRSESTTPEKYWMTPKDQAVLDGEMDRQTPGPGMAGASTELLRAAAAIEAGTIGLERDDDPETQRHCAGLMEGLIVRSTQQERGWGMIALDAMKALGQYLIRTPHQGGGRPRKLSGSDRPNLPSLEDCGVHDRRLASKAEQVARVPDDLYEEYKNGKKNAAREANFNGLMAYVADKKPDLVLTKRAKKPKPKTDLAPDATKFGPAPAEVLLAPDVQRAEMALVRFEIDQIIDNVSEDASEEQRAELETQTDALREMAGAAWTKRAMADVLAQVRDLQVEYAEEGWIILPDEDEDEVVENDKENDKEDDKEDDEEDDEEDVAAPKPAPQYTCKEVQIPVLPPPPGCARVIALIEEVIGTEEEWFYLSMMMRKRVLALLSTSDALVDEWFEGLVNGPHTDRLLSRLRDRIEEFQRS